MNVQTLHPITNGSISFLRNDVEYELHPSTIFVFGSNLAGRHGAGAAKTAVEKYGALYGSGIGRKGMSFAIPTKDYQIKTLDLRTIKSYVDIFVTYTKSNPNLNFFVTAVGTGLAGLEHKDMAPMFKGAINCWFPEVWQEYLQEE